MAREEHPTLKSLTNSICSVSAQHTRKVQMGSLGSKTRILKICSNDSMRVQRKMWTARRSRTWWRRRGQKRSGNKKGTRTRTRRRNDGKLKTLARQLMRSSRIHYLPILRQRGLFLDIERMRPFCSIVSLANSTLPGIARELSLPNPSPPNQLLPFQKY
jgi:hypothetical protein